MPAVSLGGQDVATDYALRAITIARATMMDRGLSRSTALLVPVMGEAQTLLMI
jgi:hypothetical protein